MTETGPQLQFRCVVWKKALNGNFDLVFQLLWRLDHPETMDDMTLTVFRCTAEEVKRILELYVRDYFRRDGRFRDGIGILVASPSQFRPARSAASKVQLEWLRSQHLP